MLPLPHLLPLIILLLLQPPPASARFYIGRYKTADVTDNARSLPYIVFPGEGGSEEVAGGSSQRLVERPPPSYSKIHLDPPTRFGVFPSDYGNDPYNGYTLLDKEEVQFVVPPFTPGGRVNVAFQFWVPVTLGGFFLSGRHLQEALVSPTPAASLTSLLLQQLSTNSTVGQVLAEQGSPVVEEAVRRLVEWLLPYLEVYPSRQDNTGSQQKVRRRRSLQDSLDAWAPAIGVERLTPRASVLTSRSSRSPGEAEEGWVTIGGGDGGPVRPTAPLLNHPPRPRPDHHNRLLWGSNHLHHNHIHHDDDKHKPDDDFGFPMDSHDPRPASAHHDPRPSSPSRPSSSSRPSSPSRPSSSRPFHGSRPSSDPSPPGRPPFQLTSFDDLPSGAAGGERGLDVTNRLSRLDYFFKSLHLQQEDCRRRLLCEVVRDPHTFAPLSDMISDETRVPGDQQVVSRELLSTAEGSRLLSYIEAVKIGGDRSQECEVYRYRCRMRAGQVINTDILPIWREVVRWLTVKVLAQDTSHNSLFQ